MWPQWHAVPGSLETKESGKYTRQGSNQKGTGQLQERIDRYNELFKEMVQNRKKRWALGFEEEVMESLKDAMALPIGFS